MSYLLSHTSFEFGIPELITLIFMIGVIAVVWNKLKKLKQKQEELENQFAAGNASEVVDSVKEAAEKASSELDGVAKE